MVDVTVRKRAMMAKERMTIVIGNEDFVKSGLYEVLKLSNARTGEMMMMIVSLRV